MSGLRYGEHGALRWTECPHDALIFTTPAGTIFVQPVGTERWSVRAYRPGDTESAGTFLGHYLTRTAALETMARLLEVEIPAELTKDSR